VHTFRKYLLPAISAFILFAGCGQDPVRDPLTSGVLATFRVGDDIFKVWITDEDALADVIAWWGGNMSKTIPDGKLNLGPGTVGYNQPWAWHLDQDDIVIRETAPDTCNGTPTEVNESLGEWLDDPGRYCPHDAELILLESL